MVSSIPFRSIWPADETLLGTANVGYDNKRFGEDGSVEDSGKDGGGDEDGGKYGGGNVEDDGKNGGDGDEVGGRNGSSGGGMVKMVVRIVMANYILYFHLHHWRWRVLNMMVFMHLHQFRSWS